MPLTTRTLTTLRPVVDEASLERTTGAQVQWSRVTATNADSAKIVRAFAVVGRTASGALVPRSVAATLTSVVVTANVATVTLVAHGYAVGDVITVAGANLAYANGRKTVLTVPTADTFTVEATGGNATATGTITGNYAAVGFIETDATQNAPAEAATGYGVVVGGVIYESILPDASGGPPKTLSAAIKAELVTSGCTFKFAPYTDSRA